MKAYLYNPQIVLNLLMKQFGRSLHCSRNVGVQKMADTLADGLHMDKNTAKHQVELLAGNGLLDFHSDDFASGIWHIGPMTKSL